MRLIYKIVPETEWHQAAECGSFAGSAIDRKDGYIHFSDADQACETAQRHFFGQQGLLLVAVDADRLAAEFGDAMKWETSRGGKLFPHLYAVLPIGFAISLEPLLPDGRGGHHFPVGFPA